MLTAAGAAAPAEQPRSPSPAPATTPSVLPARRLPGLQPDGTVQLPNQWSVRPAGTQLVLGDFPVNIVLHPRGPWLVVLHAGYGTHEVMTIALEKRTPRLVSRVSLAQTFNGLCFSPDGQYLFVSGGEFAQVQVFRFHEGFLTRLGSLALAAPQEKFVCGALAVDADRQQLLALGTWGDRVCLVPWSALPLDTGRTSAEEGVTNGAPKGEIPWSAAQGRLTRIALPPGSFPYSCLVDAPRKRLYVSLWAKAQVAVLNLETNRLETFFPTERHPTEMLLSPDGKTLYVACANSTQVSVLDADSGKGLETLNCALYPQAPVGNTPVSLALTPDGQLLFVANGDANNLAVFNVSIRGQARPLGFIPVGIYPTAVRYRPQDRRLYVSNGRGATPKANPHGPNPLQPTRKGITEYIAGLYRGTLTVLDLPNEEQMIAYSKQAYLCSPLRPDQGVSASRPAGNPIPARPGDPCPIKHCIYIIRENRTYDQVFGDLPQGNGAPHLCLFPEKITPNAHRLARQFVLLDNFYCDGEVSAEGHEWSMGAYCTDFVKRVWPLTYRGSPRKCFTYPAEGRFDEVARPAGGYLWDRCAEAGLSYRSYGEWIDNGKTPKDPGRARVKALEGHFDPWYRGFDLDYPDQKRADRFIEELRRFEREGDLPRLILMHLPNDHTAGTAVGKRTPLALVADNDYALGRIVEAVSHSKFWKDTAIFVVEDDAQNGPDHVDAHRTVALVISPYTRRGFVDSNLYSTSSMLRTIELILGLRPMSQFDAAARPMYASFQAQPDYRPYEHVVPDVDLNARNPKTAWGARRASQLDWSRPDAVDDLLLSELVWHAVRGPDSPMPAPVRASFFFPHPKSSDDD